jgi:hypothetical protein
MQKVAKELLSMAQQGHVNMVLEVKNTSKEDLKSLEHLQRLFLVRKCKLLNELGNRIQNAMMNGSELFKVWMEQERFLFIRFFNNSNLI